MPETSPPGPGGQPTSADSKTVRQSVPPSAVDRTVARTTPPPVTLDKTATRTGATSDPSAARTVTRTPTHPGKTILRSDPNARTVTRPPSGAPSTRGGPTGTRSGQEPDGKPFGRYRLMLELGRGGMGVVWKAYDTQLKRVVALKQILSEGGVDEEQIQRFMREARLAAKLRHPNIVGVYDVGVQDGQVYFTTDFVSGRSLDKVLKDGVPPKQAVTWVKQVAEALHYAHEQGVIHRDVKPANVLVDGKGNPFVMDFGLAKEVDQAAGVGDSNLTVSGALLGTPMYMSPEQASGRIDMLGPPTDQFSLGAMMYEMIAGRAPFKAAGLRELLNAIIEKDPLPPTRVSPKVHRDLETICLKALEKDPSRRYPTLGEMAADLGRWLDGEPISARPLSTMERGLRWAAKRRAILIPTLAAVFLTLGFGAYAVLKRSEQSELVEQKQVAEQGKADAEQARASAEQAKTSAEEGKARSEAVQAVLSRWVDLADVVRSMEEAYYDSSLTGEQKGERNRAAWGQIRTDFVEGTPQDEVSQAAMNAMAGWAARLAGLESESVDHFARARSVPDLPFGAMMEALVLFSEYLLKQPIPRPIMQPTGVSMGPIPEETPEMRDLRERMERLLDEAWQAKGWDTKTAEQFQKALGSIRTLQRGDIEGAESELTEVIQSGALSFCRSDLSYARAKVRYLSKRFEEGIIDLEAVAKVRSRHAAVYYFLGEMNWGLGVELAFRQGDPRERIRKAIERYGQALERRPDLFSGLVNRGLALLDLADAERLRGGEGLSPIRSAIADFDRLLDAQPRYAPGWLDRGIALRELATRGGAEGDPTVTIRRAIADFDEALSIDPGLVEAITNRGIAWMGVGIELKSDERDPKEAFVRALADLDLAVSRRPDPSALFYRAYARVTRARYGCSDDPLADCEAVLADVAALPEGYPQAERPKVHAMRLKAKLLKARPAEAKAALETAQAEMKKLLDATPSDADGYQRRGELWFEVGHDEYVGKQDGRESLARAIADFDEAVKLSPESIEIRLARGRAWFIQSWAIGVFRREEFQNAMRKCAEDMEWILARSPSHAKALCYRGDTREQLGRYLLALEDYAKELAAYGGKSPGTEKRIARTKKKMAGATMTMPPEWVDGCAEGKRKLDAGDAAGAKAAYEAVIADAGPNAEQEPANRRPLGAAYVGLACAEAKLPGAASRDAAFGHLQKALGLGWNDAEVLDAEAALAPLRGDPRWKSLPRK